MPLGEEHSNTLVVAVNGTTLQPDVLALLVSAYVDDSVHVPSLAVLRFSDEHHTVLEQIGARIGREMKVSVQQSGQGAPVELIEADITGVEQTIDSRGVFTVVRGLDVRHRLQSGARTQAYLNMTVSDVVKKVAADHGLQVGADSFSTMHEHLAQDGESDWELLRRLARGVGAMLWVEGRRLRFTKAVPASNAPSGTDARRDAQVIDRATNLVSLRATVTGTGQVPDVEVRAWDPATKSERVEVRPASTTAAVLQDTPAALAGALPKTRRHVVGPGTALPAATGGAADAAVAARAGGFAELEGVVRGNPKLRAATPVNLVGVGPAFLGKYVLTVVRHEFSPHDGYLTSITASDTSDRSVYGLVSAGAPGPGTDATRVLPALVTNVKDPDNLGRVKVSFPVLSGDYESWWARPVLVGAGVDRGTSWLPEVGDEVLVALGHGFDEPYVLGGLYNGKDKAGKGWAAHVGTDGKVKRRAFTSRNGMVVEFLEDGQEDTLTVSTNDGAQHLTLTQTGQKGIVLASQGALEVTAEQDVTVTGKKNVAVSTATGDITLKGTNVTIEATAKLALKATQLAATGQATAEVKAATVKINADATAELAGNAMTTIRGAMVKIN